MCLSELGRVVGVDALRHVATVDVDGRTMSVSTVTLGLDAAPPDLGDWLVVHTGFAVEQLTDTAAAQILQARQELTDRKERP